jgi:hypothetical protein
VTVRSLHSVSFFKTSYAKHEHCFVSPVQYVVYVDLGGGGLPPSAEAEPAHAAAHDARTQSWSCVTFAEPCAYCTSAHPSAFEPVEH